MNERETKRFSPSEAYQAAEHLIDTYPMLETANQLIFAGRCEGLFDNRIQLMSTYDSLLVRIQNSGPVSKEDQKFFDHYFIEPDQNRGKWIAGRKSISKDSKNVLKYQKETFGTYQEADDYIKEIEEIDKKADRSLNK